MKNYLVFSLMVVFLWAFQACSPQQPTALKEGNWHGEFLAGKDSIPFEFLVQTVDSGQVVTLRNGAERVHLNQVKVVGDSVYIGIPDYDKELKAKFSGDRIEGVLYSKLAGQNSDIPFEAVCKDIPRFSNRNKGNFSPVGRWNVQFISKADTEKNVGVFHLDDGVLTGSVLTNTGDLRYLQGVTTKDGFELSAFSGLNPYLFSVRYTDKDHFEGYFRTAHSKIKVLGVRNSNAELANPYSLTHLKPGKKTLGFQLKDENGKLVSLSDPDYKGKVVIVSILGTWCPNCRDEMAYLGPWYQKNKDRGVRIVGLSFERKADPDYAWKAIKRMTQKYGATYPVLFAGKLGTADKVLPEIDHLMSYPTTIFIDKNGKVRKIHTGFNGPATGLFYDEFKKDFNHLVDQLLAE